MALIVILFDGGMHVGWRRFRASAVPIAVARHRRHVRDRRRRGASSRTTRSASTGRPPASSAPRVAPTDPAVMFSVLGDREVGGRSGTILEGESGANDPVGIALMIGMLELRDERHGSLLERRREFAVADGDRPRRRRRRRARCSMQADAPRLAAERGPLPAADARRAPASSTASPTVAHGSGFLAVFVAGLLVGDVRRAVQGRDRELPHVAAPASREIVVFAALGLTIHSPTSAGDGLAGRARARARCSLSSSGRSSSAPLLLPVRLRPGERLFVAWGGLKGAVPILLGTLDPCSTGVDEARPHLRDRLRRGRVLGRRPGRRRCRSRPGGSACRCGSSSRSRGTSRSGLRTEPDDCGASSSRRARARLGRPISELPLGGARLDQPRDPRWRPRRSRADRRCLQPGDEVLCSASRATSRSSCAGCSRAAGDGALPGAAALLHTGPSLARRCSGRRAESSAVPGDRAAARDRQPERRRLPRRGIVRSRLDRPATVRMDAVRTDTIRANRPARRCVWSHRARLRAGRAGSCGGRPARPRRARTSCGLTVSGRGGVTVYGFYAPRAGRRRTGRARSWTRRRGSAPQLCTGPADRDLALHRRRRGACRSFAYAKTLHPGRARPEDERNRDDAAAGVSLARPRRRAALDRASYAPATGRAASTSCANSTATDASATPR